MHTVPGALHGNRAISAAWGAAPGRRRVSLRVRVRPARRSSPALRRWSSLPNQQLPAIPPLRCLFALLMLQGANEGHSSSASAMSDDSCELADPMLPPAARRVAVVGASLGGLAVATVFDQLDGFEVDVYERSDSTMERKGSGLGFVDVNAWQQLRGTRMIRRGEQAHRSQGAFYYGDLWQFLYEGLPGSVVRFGHAVGGLGDDPTRRPAIDGVAYDLVVLADGGWSSLRQHVTGTQPDYAGYVVWRGLVDAAAVPGYRTFGVFKAGIYDTIVMPLTGDGLGRDSIVCGVFVATPEAEARPPAAGTGRHAATSADPAVDEGSGSGSNDGGVPSWFLPFFRQQFGSQADGAELVRLFEAVAGSGELSAHPQYDYAANSVRAGRLLLVGDAAHMASPRTAVGAHTAILDALSLRGAFEASVAAALGGDAEDVIDEGLRRYSPDGLQRARQLLRRSQDVGRQFVPAGGLAEIVSPRLLVPPGA